MVIVSLSYFLSRFFIDNSWLDFIILFILESILFYTIFLNISYRKKIEHFKIKLANQQKKIEQLNINFEKELLNKTEKTILKCEELKLQSLKEMIKNISHQWRQPLSSISLIATSMEYEKSDTDFQMEKAKESFCIINENAQYLSQILDLFDSSLCIKKEKTVFKLESLITTLLQLQIGNIDIIYKLKNDISVYSYKKDLLQVLINIVNNVKDIFEKRDIEDRYIFIEISTENKDFIIDIKDTGGGIDEKIIHRVFEPYFTTKHQSQGTGLGLYSAYLTISKKLCGTIMVQNSSYTCEQNGKEYVGARFIIKAPKT